METDEESKARPEKMVATERLSLAKEKMVASYRVAPVGHGDGLTKKSKTREDGSYHTARVGPGDR